MFNIFKRKKDDIHSYNLTTLYNDKKVLCWEDLYKAIGIMDAVKEINDKETGRYHYKNIRANEKTINKLDEFLLDNLVNTKNRFSKMYKEKYLRSKHAMDSLCWAPFSDNNIQDDVIVMLLPNNKNFTTQIEGM